MKQEEICAYTAGFFDGEGCVYLKGHTPTVIVTQYDEMPLFFIQAHFGGKVYTRSSNIKAHDLRINGSQAILFARALLPYSILKKVKLSTLAEKLIPRTLKGKEVPILKWHDLVPLMRTGDKM